MSEELITNASPLCVFLELCAGHVLFKAHTFPFNTSTHTEQECQWRIFCILLREGRQNEKIRFKNVHAGISKFLLFDTHTFRLLKSNLGKVSVVKFIRSYFIGIKSFFFTKRFAYKTNIFSIYRNTLSKNQFFFMCTI